MDDKTLHTKQKIAKHECNLLISLRRSDVRDLGNTVSDLYIRLFAFNYQSV
jgi:hypothetical protein